MKYYDICTKKTYDSNGQQKTVWMKCGTLRVNDKGHQFIEMNHQPETAFYVFEQKQKQNDSVGEF